MILNCMVKMLHVFQVKQLKIHYDELIKYILKNCYIMDVTVLLLLQFMGTN